MSLQNSRRRKRSFKFLLDPQVPYDGNCQRVTHDFGNQHGDVVHHIQYQVVSVFLADILWIIP